MKKLKVAGKIKLQADLSLGEGFHYEGYKDPVYPILLNGQPIADLYKTEEGRTFVDVFRNDVMGVLLKRALKSRFPQIDHINVEGVDFT